jgi:hypothetical protein
MSNEETRPPQAACSDCGTLLPTEPVEPCSTCGSSRRDGFFFAGVAEGVGRANSPALLAAEYRPNYRGGSKPSMERRAGMSLTRDDQIERMRRMTFDHADDHYEETVENPDGSLLHHTSEPLSEHRSKRLPRPTADW